MLDLQQLTEAVSGSAAAFRCRTEHQPMAGEGTTVYPSTYEGGKYATVGYRDGNPGDNDRSPRYRDQSELGQKRADQVVLDSVQSQANRMEMALFDAWESGRITLPIVTVDFTGNELEKDLRITSLEAPHRIADAILRDSLLEGTPFRQSEIGRTLDYADVRNATPLFRLCPTALVFGVWDSTGPKGGLGAKFQRAVVSELVGLNAQIGVKTSSRIDPLECRAAVRVMPQKDGSWKVAKDGKVKGAVSPAEVNHGNIPPSLADGGVTIERALQTTVLSLPSLRRLRFPLQPGERSNPEVDAAARTTLAALALCAAALTRESGCDLRSRCQLFPTEAIRWELLDRPGEEPQQIELDADSAVTLFNESVEAARRAGLPWMDEEMVLQPSPQLVELVRKSQQLATAGAGGSD